ncbi:MULTISPECIES: flagellar basal-body protein FlbY [Hyphobacterium]|uniref:Flagellar basal-body protein FlbY n=1 Tax=Hyphobacterium vulgare TaxID=1736751 RepID=A0ABV7A0A2_9PROT
MSTLAADTPGERADALIRLTRRLTELLEKETALFNARRPLDTEDFQHEKTRLATLYRREIGAVKEDPSRLAGIPETAKRTLKEVTERFTEALHANGMAVDTLRVLTEGVIRSVAEEAGRQRDTLNGYGPGISPSPRTAGAPAVAVNRTA